MELVTNALIQTLKYIQPSLVDSYTPPLSSVFNLAEQIGSGLRTQQQIRVGADTNIAVIMDRVFDDMQLVSSLDYSHFYHFE